VFSEPLTAVSFENVTDRSTGRSIDKKVIK
jgi:hypothetical protein